MDCNEFLTGLAVLTKGENDDKVRDAFNLYDYDRDGHISLDEMYAYLKSVFAVIAETAPETFEKYRCVRFRLAPALLFYLQF